MRKVIRFLFCCIFLTQFFFIHIVSCDEFPSKETGSNNNRERQDSKKIESITVTAQKRQEDSQKIPIGMSVFSSIQIEDADIKNVKDLTYLVPNIHMKQGASSNVLIFRGISNDADYIHSTAGLYVDDICYSMNFMHNPSLFDIERIEVLRGPQGTLYGRNSESGVINIVTRQPDNYFTGKVSGSIGAYDPDHGSSMSYKTELNLSGPIVADKLFMGIAGAAETSDGFMMNSFTGDEKAGSIDHKNGRWTTRWLPSDKLEIGATLDVLDTYDKNGNKRYQEGPWKTDTHKIMYSTDNNVNEQKGDGQTLKIKYQAADFDLLSVTGRRFYENHMLRDSRCSPVDDGINDITFSSDQISQELRITSPEDSRNFKWLGGVYLFREKNVTDIALPVFKEARDTDMETRGYAVFGQGTMTFKKLHVTGGLRFNYDDQKGEMDYTGPVTRYTFDKSFDDTVLLPKVSISYDLTPQMMTYTTIARGYNTGGYNTGYAKNTSNFTYDPEFTWNYEAGLKSSWLDNRLNFNMALFYISIDDKQVPERDGISDLMNVKNAAKAHSQGFELEIQAKPLPGFDLFSSIGYANVEFDEWTTPDFNYSGKNLPNAPQYTANFGAQYRHISGFFGRADLILTDGYYSDAQNTQKLSGKTLVNLRTGYESKNYDLVFWCKNLFGETYQTTGFARKFDSVVDGAPRMFGVTLTCYF